MNKLLQMVKDAESNRWERTLVSTGNKENGWNFGGCNDHTAGTYTLNIFRIEVGGKIVNHPLSGKVWKYRNKKLGGCETLELIYRICDKLGLGCGALVVYNRR